VLLLLLPRVVLLLLVVMLCCVQLPVCTASVQLQEVTCL
jgi:hypothetical protein